MRKLMFAVFFSFCGFANATLIGVDIVSGGVAIENPGYTLGWGFDVTDSIAVSSLGVWDEDADGLSGIAEVGIWNSAGELLAQVSIFSNSAFAVSSVSGLGQWLFENLDTELILSAGSYFIGAFLDGDEFRTSVDTVDVSDELSNVEFGSYMEGSSLKFPKKTEDTDASLFGANLLFNTVAVSAPNILIVLALALLGMAGRTRVLRVRH